MAVAAPRTRDSVRRASGFVQISISVIDLEISSHPLFFASFVAA
jgi:hypothetical protein